jgi:hypothetical protein
VPLGRSLIARSRVTDCQPHDIVRRNMAKPKSPEHLDIHHELWKQNLRSNEDLIKAKSREHAHANRIYWLLFLYVLFVTLNSFGVVLFFFLNALSYLHVPYEVLAGWAVGSGGLGAGSLLFRTPMAQLFKGMQ